MIISKYTDKLGKVNVSIVVDKKAVKVCKNNPNFVRITVNADGPIGLDAKKQAKLGEVFNLDILADNTKKEDK